MKQNGNNKDGEPLDRLKPLVLECLHSFYFRFKQTSWIMKATRCSKHRSHSKLNFRKFPTAINQTEWKLMLGDYLVTFWQAYARTTALAVVRGLWYRYLKKTSDMHQEKDQKKVKVKRRNCQLTDYRYMRLTYKDKSIIRFPQSQIENKSPKK